MENSLRITDGNIANIKAELNKFMEGIRWFRIKIKMAYTMYGVIDVATNAKAQQPIMVGLLSIEVC
ncbi:MAG: hypothetical protein IPN76_16310 [Saprospiraceae bacterium]|nr:hypothetical protein [Saprospiraceae bacterium]